MSALTPSQFREFFTAVHGKTPFPWQERLLERLLHSGQPWPQAITLPTASGKTSCIDIALFALAAQAHLPAAERTAPRRIAFVVDRRIIVDEAYNRARHIARELQSSKKPIVQAISARLLQIGGDYADTPLQVVSLRGGVVRDQSWARTPTQPLVICSTVDQIGSRLLFRGYGASESAWPIHAGLVGNDMLILLDEAHIAEPFLQTAQAVARYRIQAAEPVPAPFHFVVMSATPPQACQDRFPAVPEDLAPDRDHPVLGPRWSVSKPATLKVANGTTTKNFVEKVARKLVEEARKLASADRKVIGILVNRVATARAVRSLLAKDRCVLLTGRMRPYDRDIAIKKAETDYQLSTAAAGKRNHEQPVFIVATQCLEVGADIDFDGLVTECASLDALRQRFGRLNRGGRAIAASATIVIREDQVPLPKESKDADPVYGSALAQTWAWLLSIAKNGRVDFGIEALAPHLAALPQHESAQLRAAVSDAPVMLPAHVDVWCQTNPEPTPSPDVSLFLHGRSAAAPEVSLCWRLDLGNVQNHEANAAKLDRISLSPPAAAECLNVPLWAFQQWLESGAPSDLEKLPLSGETDAHTSLPQQTSTTRAKHNLPALLCWRGHRPNDDAEDSQRMRSFVLTEPADAEGLRRGDTIILGETGSAAYWLGKDIKDIDLGDRVQLTTRARPTLRLHPELMAYWPDCDGTKTLVLLAQSDLTARMEDRKGTREEVCLALQDLSNCAGRSLEWQWLADAARCLTKEFESPKRFERSVYAYGDGVGILFRSSRRWSSYASDDAEELLPDDSLGSSRSSQAVTLKEHSEGVASRVGHYATAAGLPPALREALITAARWHDLGKADPRFQAMLLATSRGVLPSVLLAKSARLPSSRKALEAQRETAGYPKGARHELLSVCLAKSAGAAWDAVTEKDLVLYLIGTHHGQCRPFAPVVNDDCAGEVRFSHEGQNFSHDGPTELERLDSGIADRFWRLQRRFGSWGLAWLESMLRLADQQESAAEQDATTNSNKRE